MPRTLEIVLYELMMLSFEIKYVQVMAGRSCFLFDWKEVCCGIDRQTDKQTDTHIHSNTFIGKTIILFVLIEV